MRGLAPDAAGGLARLVDAVGNEYTRVVDEQHHFYFDHLPPGEYALHVEGGYVQEELALDGKAGAEVLFSPLVYEWTAEQAGGGAMPGFSLLRVEVEGLDDWPVHIWQEDGESVVVRTGTKREFGAHVAEFGPLEPGTYMVEPDELEIRTEVELTGLEIKWVHFRRVSQPLAPNVVRPLAPVVPKPSPAALPEEDPPEDAPASALPKAASPKPTSTPGSYYIYIGDGLFTGTELQRVVQFVGGRHIDIGRDMEAALQAACVAVVGDLDGAMLAQLRNNGVTVMEWPWTSSPDGNQPE